MNEQKSDPKLAFLLSSGDLFLGEVDPGKMTRNAKVQKISFTAKPETKELEWSLAILFKNNDGLLVKGVTDGTGITVNGILVPGKDEWKQVSDTKGNNITECIGKPELLPSRVKKNLMPPTWAEGNVTKPTGNIMERILNLSTDAVFWSTDDTDGHYRVRFRNVKIHYDIDTNGMTEKATVSAVCRMKKGKITVSCSADIFGLYDKKVVLEKDLGEGKKVKATCTAETNGKTIPSVRTAFDLYNAIPDMYTDQIHESQNKGKPKKKTGRPKTKPEQPRTTKTTESNKKTEEQLEQVREDKIQDIRGLKPYERNLLNKKI